MLLKSNIVIALLFALATGAPAPAQEGASSLKAYDLENPASTTWGLPKGLKDVSGLALAPDGRLFAVEEERAILHEIDYVAGKLVKTFTFGRPAAKKDFSGIAIAGKRFFVINPKGLLLEGREGIDYEAKVFNAFDTGFGETCKIQGLVAHEGKLLALCGGVEDKAYSGFLTILSWDIAARKADEEPYLKIPWGGADFPEDLSDFSPSALAARDDGGLFVLSSDKQVIVEVDPAGEILGWGHLNKKAFDNPVGLALTADNRLIIADAGRDPTVQVFDPVRGSPEN